jgi:hypothetical protein
MALELEITVASDQLVQLHAWCQDSLDPGWTLDRIAWNSRSPVYMLVVRLTVSSPEELALAQLAWC